ncbi:methylcrotonoyl-coa carboxylase subunit alpha -related [Anaeramoeba ignava]|uniref:propionyl-CoA carboxylase n=1 Tax=Anaeramoeba ignava TaxID=1746090 RepID=A0A9Q0LMX7_ANAIG|nr:methylcrotonoyl-coa carboxylase subunit alpha -related [Anaeramoeba ignava]
MNYRIPSFSSSLGIFKKILIANRGEIACSIINTAKKMKIKTVAIHSPIEYNSLHVKLADESINIDSYDPKSSYMDINKIIQAAKKTGVQAIHPGYGFWSEDPEYAQEVLNNGFAFIGPNTKAMSIISSKSQSKQFAQKLKINFVPGNLENITSVEQTVNFANQIGFPIMMKCKNRQGSIFHVARNEDEVYSSFPLIQDELNSVFGNCELVVEKLIEDTHHISIQIIGDNYGNVVYLNDCDCSIQRRNGKFVEESPAFVLDESTRRKLGFESVLLAKALNYNSAGTCEFLFNSKTKETMFLEMNPRIPVENNLTKFTTGIDLIELMIRISAGEKLPFNQSQIKLNGCASEVRIYAEDPQKGFLPSIGTIIKYSEPDPRNKYLFCQSGVVEGDEITTHYDPLLSILVTFGKTRTSALKEMKIALEDYVIEGVNQNISFLRALLDQKDYNSGNFSTQYIEKYWPEGFKGVELKEESSIHLVASSVVIDTIRKLRDYTISGNLEPSNFRNEEIVVQLMNKEYSCFVLDFSDNAFVVEIDKKIIYVDDVDWTVDGYLFKAFVDGIPVTVQVVESLTHGYIIRYIGTKFQILVGSKRMFELLKWMPQKKEIDQLKFIAAPMAGKIYSMTQKKSGDSVHKGEELFVIEAMKMQNRLVAKNYSTIKSIFKETGDKVSVDEILIEFY